MAKISRNRKAAQDLAAKIESLEDRVAALEAARAGVDSGQERAAAAMARNATAADVRVTPAAVAKKATPAKKQG